MADADTITILISDEAFARSVAYAHKMACEADDIGGQGLVYFVAPIGGGNIKIGVTQSPERRLPELQRFSPVELELVACAPGGKAVEAHYHAMFVNDRLHGEWFHPSERLLKECERLASIWIG